MASQDEKSTDKLTSDAQRMKTRNFGGYLADRALGRADFAKSKQVAPAVAAPMGDQSVLDRREKAAGLKRGGAVKARGDGVASRGKTRGTMR